MAAPIAPKSERRAIVHQLFHVQLGSEQERYFAALRTIAELHAKLQPPELGWRVDGGRVPSGKHIDIIVKELR